ncbi:MAG: iron ABC transporter permease, partial [Veillonella sp.]|nr:iron ABC transporter permease [Veillonella sp.]
MTQSRAIAVQWGLLLMLAISLVLALGIGSVMLSPSQVWHIIWAQITGQDSGLSPALVDIIWDIRLPRVLLAAIVGAGLALSGLIMQASVQNPLAEPFILGIASGASVGAVGTILLGGTILIGGMSLGVPMGAFLGAIIATLGVLLLAGIQTRMSTVRLILAGAVVSALCTALSNFIIYMAGNTEGIQTATFWMMGSLSNARWDGLVLPMAMVALMVAYFASQVRSLDALLLGEEAA